MRELRATFIAAGACVILLAAGAIAQEVSPSSLPREVFIEQRLGARVPGDLVFIDEQERPIRIGDCWQGKPTILVLAYYTCPNLCPMVLRHMTQGLNGIALQAGRDFNVVVASFDPRDDSRRAALQKRNYIRGYNRHDLGQGWTFLTGPQSAIDALKQAVGFHARYDSARQSFAHPTGLILLTPRGEVSHYFLGVDYAPADLQSALQDAQAGRCTPSAPADQQYCFNYDPRDGRHGRLISLLLRGASGLWVLGILAYIGTKLARELRSRGRGPSPGNEKGRRP